MQGIYAIRNKKNNKQYVGSALNIEARWKRHLLQLKKKNHHSVYLLRAWEKYGPNEFEFVILEEVQNKEDIITREQWWIDNSKSKYNMSPTAGSSLGIKRRPETLKRLSESRKGKKQTPEWIANKVAAQSGDNHWTRKKKFTDEAKKRMSDAQKRLHLSGFHPRSGKTHNAETKLKLARAKFRAVNQYDMQGNFIARWESALAYGRSIGKNYNPIIKALKGIYSQTHGYIWKYADE